MKATEIIRLLKEDGWYFKEQREVINNLFME